MLAPWTTALFVNSYSFDLQTSFGEVSIASLKPFGKGPSTNFRDEGFASGKITSDSEMASEVPC